MNMGCGTCEGEERGINGGGKRSTSERVRWRRVKGALVIGVEREVGRKGVCCRG